MTGQTNVNHDSELQRRNAARRSGKISDEFADRLAALPPGQRVRAVVLPAPYLVSGNAVNGNAVNSNAGARTRGEARQAIVREVRTRTEETFADIDKVLAERGGKRLTECGNALGFIVVETCPDGIAAIADLGWVGTVMEDQAIRPVQQPDQPATR